MVGKPAFRDLIDDIHDHFATSVNEKLCGRPITNLKNGLTEQTYLYI